MIRQTACSIIDFQSDFKSLVSTSQTTFFPRAPTPHVDTHLCSAHSASSALLFLLVQLLLLAFLNNSIQVRITISYSILNMPKKSNRQGTGGPASISPFVTDNRQTNSFCYNARCIVSHQFCTWPFPPPPLPSSHVFLFC